MNTKVRLVICPRCRQVLPELEDLPVYKCGGCGIVLHAKNQANDIRDQGLCSKETDTDQKIDLGQFSEDRDESFANQQVVLSAGLSISGKSKNEFEDYMEEPGHGKLSDEVLTSTALTCHKNEEPLPEAMENMKLDKEQSPLGHCNGNDQDENKDCHMKRSSVNFSIEVSSLVKFGHHENESLTGAEAKRKHVENTCSLQQNAKIDQIELKNCNDKYVGNVNMSNEVSSSARLPSNELEEPSVEAEDDTDVHGVFKSSRTENFIAARSRNSVITAQRSLGESIFAENLPSPDSGQLEKTPRSMVWGLDCGSPEETLDNITLLNPNSHLNDTVDEMSNSPDTKSYYAYRGNASCYDETNECISQGHLHPSRRNFRDAYSFNKKGLQRQGEFTGKKMMSSDSQMQCQTITSSSIMQGNKHRVMKGKWPFDELMEPLGHGHSARSKMQSEKKEHLSRLPFYSMSCQGEYGHDGRPLNYGKNEFQYYSPLHSPDMCTKPDKMELLRMVYDLQDQLNRTHISKGEVTGMLPTRVVEKERQTSLHNHCLASKEELYPDLSCPTYFGECVQDQKWPQHRKISKGASSCETTYTRCHCPCLDRSSQGRNQSAQLPSHAFHYNDGHIANKRRYSSNLHNFGHSNHSSPQHYTSSEFSLWTCDTISEDHGHEDHEMKKIHLRRKQHFMKSHIRPQAGGAPVVSCYHCSELLQFPADFLLFRRRLHRLKCGACSEVLKFSLQSRIHLVPYFSDAAIHQPKKDTEHKSLSNSTYDIDCAYVEPVSCSDEYEKSFHIN